MRICSNTQNHRAGRAGWIACLLVASLLLGACQGAPAAPMDTLAPPTGIPTTAPSRTSLPATPDASPTAQASATAGNTLAPTPVPTISVTPAPAAARKIVMPILMYHHVNDDTGTRYSIQVESFRKQMEMLKQEGYETVTVSQVADAIRGEGNLPSRPVAITFDDGYLDTYENAFPILQELGFTATVYIITGTLGTKKSYGYMQVDALKTLSDAGWEIGSHGVTHTDLNKTKLGAGNEMKQSKEDLETKLGIKVRSFSYPFGIANQSLKDLAVEMGYDSGVGIDILNTHGPSRLFFLSRREVYRSLPLFGFANLLTPSKQDNLLATQSAVMSQTQTPAP
jgi:peptidoglycan/xylan/chitin deacetylase (PgdA/CDA1 family)